MPDIPCPLCDAADCELVHETAVTRGLRARHVICRQCGFVYHNPPWDQPQIEAFYAHVSRYYHEAYLGDRLSGEWRAAQQAEAARRVEGLRRLAPAGATVLDVGAGNGAFVEAARAAGFSARGIELDEDAVKDAAARGLPVALTPFEQVDAPPGSLDAITMFDVLEHCADLAGFLGQARRLLQPGGVLLLEVPDALHVHMRLDYFLVPEHNWHFTRTTLTRLLAREGWEVAEVVEVATPDRAADALAVAARPSARIGVTAGPTEVGPSIAGAGSSGEGEYVRVREHLRAAQRRGYAPRAVAFRDRVVRLLGPRVGNALARGVIGGYVAAKKALGLYRYPPGYQPPGSGAGRTD